MTAITRILILSLILSLTSLAQAETPNIQPGQWEYQTRMTVEAPFPVPEQNDTTSDCVTAEDVAEANTFMGDMDVEECEITREEMRRDGASYEMVCQAEGMTMNMTMELQFMGDRSEGLITSQAETPMGPMETTIEMSGRRIGECE
ncbi:MAG: DUF3617 domain-containing protein [Wenzhouxiangella sp.]